MRLRKARPVADKTPAWRAERRRIFHKEGAHYDYDAPIGAPFPRYSRGSERDYGVPGAAKNTGDDPWLYEN
jgi:hypothetical protein